MADANRVAQWLSMLGALVNSSMNQKEAEGQIALYTKLLMTEFETDAFNQRSLADVAKQCKFWPSYAELHEALAKWWSIHRPPLPALPEPDLAANERVRLADDWGNPDAVRRSIAICAGDLKMLRLLGKIVNRHAPQNVELLPPYARPDWIDGEAA